VKRVLLGLATATALVVLWLFAVWPPPLWYRSHWPAETAFMAMRAHGDGGRHGASYRPMPLDSISPLLVQAVLIGEDNRFWTHPGIDFVEVRRALGYRRPAFSWGSPRDIVEVTRSLGQAWSRRDALRGASTITQQLAKNLYLSPSRNPLRKVKEAVTAFRLEGALGKRRILELYLNVVEMGDGVWGAQAASERYFGRPANALSRPQAAALAGTLPFPLLSNPSYRPGRMRWRQNLILRRMQGERIEIPKVIEEVKPEPAESILHTPAMDSLLDSLRAPVETLPPDPER
jgi:monofunctional glycosyltransferase